MKRFPGQEDEDEAATRSPLEDRPPTVDLLHVVCFLQTFRLIPTVCICLSAPNSSCLLVSGECKHPSEAKELQTAGTLEPGKSFLRLP